MHDGGGIDAQPSMTSNTTHAMRSNQFAQDSTTLAPLISTKFKRMRHYHGLSAPRIRSKPKISDALLESDEYVPVPNKYKFHFISRKNLNLIRKSKE